jgi:glutamate 5-kinase
VAQGGMEAKLRAAMAAAAGGAARVRVVAGSEPDVLARLLGGEELGTLLAA